MKKYKVLYQVNHAPEGVTKEEAESAGAGATDNIVLIAMLGTPGANEQLDIVKASLEGRSGGSLSASQEWTVWLAWAGMLAASEDLTPAKRRVCSAVLEGVREAMNASKTSEFGGN